jgi:formyl-CoA transferase
VTRSPLLGEHTNEVLSELGYSGMEIDALRKERVI